MTKRKRPGGPPRKALSPDARERAITLYGTLIEAEMLGMIKAENLEDKYARVRAAKRALTEQQFTALARRAAEYFVDHKNPSQTAITRDECARLTEAAINHALEEFTRAQDS